jgi:YteA family regulatory protein
MDGMQAQDRDRIRRLLAGKRDELLRLRARARERELGQSAAEATGELSEYDNHPADAGTETWQRSQLLALRAEQGSRLAAVESALRRLAAGTYGTCTRCGGSIERERLLALPETPLCKSCREALEAEGAGERQRRPVEEDRLSPPFARTLQDGEDGTAFAGEDAWQAVARYGSSDTPSDVPAAHRYPNIVTDPDERRGAANEVEELPDEEGERPDPKNRQGT